MQFVKIGPRDHQVVLYNNSIGENINFFREKKGRMAFQTK